MTYLESIEHRISRRSYTGALSDEDFALLNEEARKINDKSELCISIVQNGPTLFGGFRHNYGMFSGVHSFFVFSGPENDPHLREKIGYFGEKLLLDATKLGLGTCWVGGTFDRQTLARTLKAGHTLIAVAPVGPIKEKQTAKEKLLYKVAHSSHKTANELMDFDVTPPTWFLQGVEAASKAPSALNKQPVKFAWKKGIATAEIAAERDAEWIDLGIAKFHFEAAVPGSFALGNSAVFTPVGEANVTSL